MAEREEPKGKRFIIGKHHGVLEPDRIINFNYVGDVSLNDTLDMMEAADSEWGSGYQLMINIADLGTVEADARKHIAQETRVTATALYGGGFAQRVVANLMIRAIGMVNRNAVPTKLFASEKDARAWLGSMKD